MPTYSSWCLTSAQSIVASETFSATGRIYSQLAWRMQGGLTLTAGTSICLCSFSLVVLILSPSLHSSSLSSWIRSKTDELAAAEPVAGRPEAVEKQLEDLQVGQYSDHIHAHARTLTHTYTRACTHIHNVL